MYPMLLRNVFNYYSRNPITCMDPVTAKTVPIRSDGIVSREIEGELIIVPIASGIGDIEDDLYTLNDTGQKIWDRIDGKRTLGNIAADLAQEYAAPVDEITTDVIGLVTELATRKIVLVKG